MNKPSHAPACTPCPVAYNRSRKFKCGADEHEREVTSHIIAGTSPSWCPKRKLMVEATANGQAHMKRLVALGDEVRDATMKWWRTLCAMGLDHELPDEVRRACAALAAEEKGTT